MENMALVLIVVTLFLLIIIVGLLSVLVFKLLNQKPQSQPLFKENNGEAPRPDVSKADLHPEILNRMKQLEKVKAKRADLFCPNHSEEPGEVSCSICDKIFCKACIKPFKTMHFCKEHLPLIMRHDWDEVLTVKTSTQDPEEGVRLYDIKKELFEKEDLPTYIETHYKINVDHDYIETYLVLFGMKEKIEVLKEKLKSFILD